MGIYRSAVLYIIVCSFSWTLCAWQQKTMFSYCHEYDLQKIFSAKNILHDILLFNQNVLSKKSYMILVAGFPFYCASRMADERIHSYFYCAAEHKNRLQMPHYCNTFARYGLAVPLIGLSLPAFFAQDETVRVTSWGFMLGIPLLGITNKIIKEIQFSGCYRPWHESFSRVKRSPGGFPSGHAAYVSYMIVVWGLQYGPRIAVPLAMYGTFMSINFCVCNRHFLSQIVAGTILGTIYACAAHTFIKKYLSDHGHFFVTMNKQGMPCVGISYSF